MAIKGISSVRLGVYRVSMKFRFLVFLIVVVSSMVGCAGPSNHVARTAPKTMGFQGSAEYNRGLLSLRNGDYTKALESFQSAARGPSYVKYTALARLRLADSLYYQDLFDEAVEGYRGFIELNVADPNLHYAYFRMGESKMKSISGDFLLMPPADRRDPQRIWAALNMLEDFVRRFPNSPHIEEGLALRDKMVKMVSSYEMEVARFYMTRKKPVGAVNRIQKLMVRVPSVRNSEDVHLALAQALASSKNDKGLKIECETYEDKFPAGRHRSKVKRLCAGVDKSDGDSTGSDFHGG